MKLFLWIADLLVDRSIDTADDFLAGQADLLDDNDINPANGLPMIGGIGGIDIEGNVYGQDMDNYY